MWSTLCSASAVYLTASVVPQARRAIRRRRVVFRREVPSNTHRVASQHRTHVALAGCTTGERAVCLFWGLASLTCRLPQVAHHLFHLACVGGPSLTPWPGGNGQRCKRLQRAGGPYRSLSCLSVARQPCRSRAHRVDSCDAAPHTLRSPDPDSTPDVWQLVGCRSPALCLLVMYTEDAPIEMSTSLPVGCGVLRAGTLNH